MRFTGHTDETIAPASDGPVTIGSGAVLAVHGVHFAYGPGTFTYVGIPNGVSCWQCSRGLCGLSDGQRKFYVVRQSLERHASPDDVQIELHSGCYWVCTINHGRRLGEELGRRHCTRVDSFHRSG